VRVIATNTGAFAIAFAVWVIFGPSLRFISNDLGVPIQLAALVKTLPILIGSLLRIPAGILSDLWGARNIFAALMATGGAACWVLSLAQSSAVLLAAGACMGLVGVTFVCGVQAISAQTPKSKQGLALGILGAGNIGAAVTTFGLPVLLTSFGWRPAFRIYSIVCLVTALVYWLATKPVRRSGSVPSMTALLAPLGQLRTWRFGYYYMATFGVFVAATLMLIDIYIDGYHLTAVQAGGMSTVLTLTAALCRITGGKLSDHFGARPVTRWSLVISAVAFVCVSARPPLAVTVAITFVAAAALGIGMAACFRYLPDYYPSSVGAVSGLIGALGGVGGFLLPQLGAQFCIWTGSVFSQLWPLAAISASAVVLQSLAVRRISRVTVESTDLSRLVSAVGPASSAALTKER